MDGGSLRPPAPFVAGAFRPDLGLGSPAAEKLSHVWPGFSFAFFRFVFDSCLGSFTVIGSLPFSPFSWVFLNCANWPGFLGEELRGLSVLASLHWESL